jgi:hypothetical protein
MYAMALAKIDSFLAKAYLIFIHFPPAKARGNSHNAPQPGTDYNNDATIFSILNTLRIL